MGSEKYVITVQTSIAKSIRLSHASLLGWDKCYQLTFANFYIKGADGLEKGANTPDLTLLILNSKGLPRRYDHGHDEGANPHQPTYYCHLC